MTRIILERLKDAADKKLLQEQAVFMKEKSCTGQIATLGIVIEQSSERQFSLYLNFVDFDKASDSVGRSVISSFLNHSGIIITLTDLAKEFYKGAMCQVIHSLKLTVDFEVKTGLRQGCLLSPTSFLSVLNCIAHQAPGDTTGQGSDTVVSHTAPGRV